MQPYLVKGTELLKLLNNNGYEGYFVGDAVRNIIMNRELDSVEILTNARLDTLERTIFNNIMFQNNIEYVNDNLLKVNYGDYYFFISSFNGFENNSSISNIGAMSKHYSKSLLNALSTRDYTINSIARATNGKVVDIFDGINDIKKKTIRCVGNPKNCFTNKPLTMLKGMELISELKFSLAKKTNATIHKKAKLISNVEIWDIVDELKKILKGEYAKNAVASIVSTGIYKYIPSLSKGIKKLSQHFSPVSFEELLLLSFVLNNEIDEEYIPYIDNFELFKKVYNLALINPKSKYDQHTLFSNGLEVCLMANHINVILGKSKNKSKVINKDYNKLPIKKVCDLQYKGEDILKNTELHDVEVISNIMDDVCNAVLIGEIHNDYNEIEKFVLDAINNLSGTEVNHERDFDINTHVITEDNTNDESEDLSSIGNTYQEVNDENYDAYTDHRLKMLEERLDEQDRLLKEKSAQLKEMEHQKVLEVSSKMVGAFKELISKDTQVSSVVKDQYDFEAKYRQFIIDYLEARENNHEEN